MPTQKVLTFSKDIQNFGALSSQLNRFTGPANLSQAFKDFKSCSTGRSINVQAKIIGDKRKDVDDLLMNLPPDSPTAAMKFLSGNQMGQSSGSGF